EVSCVGSVPVDYRIRLRRRSWLAVSPAIALVTALGLVVTALAALPGRSAASGFVVGSLDRSRHHLGDRTWGMAGTQYGRVAAARYADGRSAPVTGPNSRFISNRVFNDVHQNVFSEHRVSQWGNVWGQFIDHTIGLRDAAGEQADIPFSTSD